MAPCILAAPAAPAAAPPRPAAASRTAAFLGFSAAQVCSASMPCAIALLRPFSLLRTGMLSVFEPSQRRNLGPSPCPSMFLRYPETLVPFSSPAAFSSASLAVFLSASICVGVSALVSRKSFTFLMLLRYFCRFGSEKALDPWPCDDCCRRFMSLSTASRACLWTGLIGSTVTPPNALPASHDAALPPTLPRTPPAKVPSGPKADPNAAPAVVPPISVPVLNGL